MFRTPVGQQRHPYAVGLQGTELSEHVASVATAYCLFPDPLSNPSQHTPGPGPQVLHNNGHPYACMVRLKHNRQAPKNRQFMQTPSAWTADERPT